MLIPPTLWIYAASLALANGPYPVEKALASFQIAPGFKVELVAAEPAVVDPVEIAFDAAGRMFVVEMRDYPTGAGEGKAPPGRIALLTDPDGDGRYERKTTFADGLHFPNGVLPYDDGVFVTSAPDLLYLKDADGDGIADQRRVVYSGFAAENTQLRVSHPRLAINNWIYLANGLRGGTVTDPDQPDAKPLPIPRNNFRFKPGSDHYEATAGFAQFGLTFSAEGQQFVCSNRNPNKHVVLEQRHLERNPFYAFSQTEVDTPEEGIPVKVYPISSAQTTAGSHAGTFTAACGIEIYTGDQFPEAYRGNAFICEPTGNLVHRDILVPDGASFIARRARPGVEFLASPDTWFRPVNAINGPDGALYICDMVRKTIEHPDFLTESVRRVTDFESGKTHGRIWRILPASAQREPPVVPVDFETKQLVATLAHPNAWQRQTAQRLLVEQKDPAAADLLAQTLKSASSKFACLHAMYTLDGIGGLHPDHLLAALNDRDSVTRYHAVRLAEAMLNDVRALRDRLFALAEDPHPRVRFEVALALGGVDDDRNVDAFAHIIVQDVRFKWSRVAVLAGLAKRADRLMAKLIEPDADFLSAQRSTPDHAGFLYDLAAIVGVQSSEQTITTFIETLNRASPDRAVASRLSALTGLADGLRRRRPQPPTLTQLTADQFNPSDLFGPAAGLAADAKVDVHVRVDAARWLAHAPYDLAGETLVALLDPHQPAELQRAAASAIGQIDDPKLAAALLDANRWRAYTPPVRGEVVAALFRRPPSILKLLDAIQAGDVQPWTLDSSRRTQLLKHQDDAIKTRAAALFENSDADDRQKTYNELAPLLKAPASGKNGKTVFKTHCATCHLFDGMGQNVGPDLFNIGTQAKETILMHIIMPNQTVVPEYTNYLVETDDGEAYTGLIASETPTSITLRRAEGATDTILRTNIRSMFSTSLSLMPQDHEKNMTRQELADLVEYLKNGVHE
jgi:putative membrane-bound dehydrogenase-like protein